MNITTDKTVKIIIKSGWTEERAEHVVCIAWATMGVLLGVLDFHWSIVLAVILIPIIRAYWLLKREWDAFQVQQEEKLRSLREERP